MESSSATKSGEVAPKPEQFWSRIQER